MTPAPTTWPQALARIQELERDNAQLRADLQLVFGEGDAETEMLDWRLPGYEDTHFPFQERRVLRILHRRMPNAVHRESLREVLRARNSTDTLNLLNQVIHGCRSKLRGTEYRIEREYGLGYRLVRSKNEPENEIEITPEMLAAGASEFHSWEGLEFGTAKTAAYAIFKAMVAAAPRTHAARSASRGRHQR